MGDCSDVTWTQTPGHDSVWQAYIGRCLTSYGYEYRDGVHGTLMTHNDGEIRFYINNRDSLDKYLNSFTASSYGPATDCGLPA